MAQVGLDSQVGRDSQVELPTQGELAALAQSVVANPRVGSTPGHLIRRCQQIAVAIFLDEFKSTSLTPVQFAALSTIAAKPGLDQSALVNLIAVDRSTIGAILRGLEQRGLVSRVTPQHNQRVKQLFIQPAGEDLLRATPVACQRTDERILSPLSTRERAMFMCLLARVVDGNNEFSRAPVRPPRAIGGADG